MLGKKPATRTPRLLKLTDFIEDKTKLPPLPTGDFGNGSLIKPGSWGMLGNDTVGDCVIAGGLHEVLLINAVAGRAVPLSTQAAIKNYSAITGYDPQDPSTDQGTDMEAAAKYRRTHGLVDAAGNTHKIAAYLDLEPGDPEQLWYAGVICDAFGIGVEFPTKWMDAWNSGGLWDKISHPKIDGGHYIVGDGRQSGHAPIVSWGEQRPILTLAGYKQFNDQTLAYITKESLVNGKDENGFSYSGLRAALTALTSA